MEPYYYHVDITWSKDRKGVMCSPELNATQVPINATSGQEDCGCIEVATPPEFPKGMPGIWSPEHLYTAAASSCLMTTFLAIADNSKLPFQSFRCHSRGKLEKTEGKFLMTEVQLEPVVVIGDEKDMDKAYRVLEKAETNCLISNSMKTNVVMKPLVEVEKALQA